MYFLFERPLKVYQRVGAVSESADGWELKRVDSDDLGRGRCTRDAQVTRLVDLLFLKPKNFDLLDRAAQQSITELQA